MQSETMRGAMPAIARSDPSTTHPSNEPALYDSSAGFDQIPESFGRRLRAVRERRRISIAAIAESTKILGALLDGLEHDDVSRWPTGLYRRAFIRAYATAIGLDPEPVVREFMARFPDPEDVAPPPLPIPVAPAPRAVLRLTRAEPVGLNGRTMRQMIARRLLAVVTDAMAIGWLAAVMYLVLGTLWAPLALAALAYYVIGTLLFGTTPGACLAASTGHRADAAPGRLTMPAGWSALREHVWNLTVRVRAAAPTWRSR